MHAQAHKRDLHFIIMSPSSYSSICLTTKSWLCKPSAIRVQGARGGELSVFICSGFGLRCQNTT